MNVWLISLLFIELEHVLMSPCFPPFIPFHQQSQLKSEILFVTNKNYETWAIGGSILYKVSKFYVIRPIRAHTCDIQEAF